MLINLPPEVISSIASSFAGLEVALKLAGTGNRLLTHKLRTGHIGLVLTSREPLESVFRFVPAMRIHAIDLSQLKLDEHVQQRLIGLLPRNLRSFKTCYQDFDRFWTLPEPLIVRQDPNDKFFSHVLLYPNLWRIRSTFPNLEVLHISSTSSLVGNAQPEVEKSMAVVSGFPLSLTDLDMPFNHRMLYAMLPPNIEHLGRAGQWELGYPNVAHAARLMSLKSLQMPRGRFGVPLHTFGRPGDFLPPSLLQLSSLRLSLANATHHLPLLPNLRTLNLSCPTTLPSEFLSLIRLLPDSIVNIKVTIDFNDTERVVEPDNAMNRPPKTFPNLKRLSLSIWKRPASLGSVLTAIFSMTPLVEDLTMKLAQGYVALETLESLAGPHLHSLNAPLDFDCFPVREAISPLSNLFPGLRTLSLSRPPQLEVPEYLFNFGAIPPTVTSFEAPFAQVSGDNLHLLPPSVLNFTLCGGNLVLNKLRPPQIDESRDPAVAASFSTVADLYPPHVRAAVSKDMLHVRVSLSAPIVASKNLDELNSELRELKVSARDFFTEPDFDASKLPNLTTLTLTGDFDSEEDQADDRLAHFQHLTTLTAPTDPIEDWPPNLTRLTSTDGCIDRPFPDTLLHLKAYSEDDEMSGIFLGDHPALLTLELEFLDTDGWSPYRFPFTLTSLEFPGGELWRWEDSMWKQFFEDHVSLRKMKLTGTITFSTVANIYKFGPKNIELDLSWCDQVDGNIGKPSAIISRLRPKPGSLEILPGETIDARVARMIPVAYPALRKAKITAKRYQSNNTDWKPVLRYLAPSTTELTLTSIGFAQLEKVNWPAHLTSIIAPTAPFISNRPFHFPPQLKKLVLTGDGVPDSRNIFQYLPPTLTFLNAASMVVDGAVKWPPGLTHLDCMFRGTALYLNTLRLPPSLTHFTIRTALFGAESAPDDIQCLPCTLRTIKIEFTDSEDVREALEAVKIENFTWIIDSSRMLRAIVGDRDDATFYSVLADALQGQMARFDEDARIAEPAPEPIIPLDRTAQPLQAGPNNKKRGRAPSESATELNHASPRKK